LAVLKIPHLIQPRNRSCDAGVTGEERNGKQWNALATAY